MHRIARNLGLIAIAATLLGESPAASASKTDGPWQQSIFIGVGLGAGFDTNSQARMAIDAYDREVESYSSYAFLFGVHAGYRFNEIFGIESGWHEQQHDAFREWGGYAGYHLLHLGFRLAWPLPTRQTVLLKLGACTGGFEYGSASFGAKEDNATFAIGPIVSLAAEHELGLGAVAFLDLSWIALQRYGMSGPLELHVSKRDDAEAEAQAASSEPMDVKDFTRDVTAHLLWLRTGIQFEWTLP